jgi:hypothetical protein
MNLIILTNIGNPMRVIGFLWYFLASSRNFKHKIVSSARNFSLQKIYHIFLLPFSLQKAVSKQVWDQLVGRFF